MRKGSIYLAMTGHRKPTTYRCNLCSAAAGHAVWHSTHRGIGEPCPLETPAKRKAPALIAKHKLGTFGTRRPKRRINLNLADVMPANIPGVD